MCAAVKIYETVLHLVCQIMHTNTLLSTKVLYILIYIINIFLCEKITLHDLNSIVRKNVSKNWLESLKLVNSTNQYCHLCCINISSEIIGKHCGSHTLCKYPNNRTGPACKGFIHIKFTIVEKKALLDAHNTLRNTVASGLELKGQAGPQPSAANMRLLQWNDELALTAERWAAQCIYSNDVCRDLERFPVGQNIAYGNLATNNELSFVKRWYDEVKDFDNINVKNFKGSDLQHSYSTKHYSQLVWADTYQIGCARAIFQESKGAAVSYREHFICNYGPTGNIPRQPVYLVGAPCSACHEGTTCTLDYPSLCGGEGIQRASEEVYDTNNLRNIKIKAKSKPVKNGYEINGSSFMILCIFYGVREIFISL